MLRSGVWRIQPSRYINCQIIRRRQRSTYLTNLCERMAEGLAIGQTLLKDKGSCGEPWSSKFRMDMVHRRRCVIFASIRMLGSGAWRICPSRYINCHIVRKRQQSIYLTSLCERMAEGQVTGQTLLKAKGGCGEPWSSDFRSDTVHQIQGMKFGRGFRLSLRLLT